MTLNTLLISCGQGPAEAQHFVELLRTRLVRILRQSGVSCSSQVLPGKRTATVSFAAPLLPALRKELGTHALLLRERTQKRKRSRFYAQVSFETGEAEAPQQLPAILPQDLEMTACRASGPGGQNVNKRSTAVQLRYLPTGLTVRSQVGRTQEANRRHAVRLLEQTLRMQNVNASEARKESQHLERRSIERGGAIRQYTLTPNGQLQEAT